MKRAAIPIILALAFVAALFVAIPRDAQAQHTPSTGCKSNCTFTGTTYASDAGFYGTITSLVPTGNDAIKLTTGGRLHLGSGSGDYIYSDGTNAVVQAGLAAGSLTATNDFFIGSNSVIHDLGSFKVKFSGYANDTASSIGITLNSGGTTLATSGAKILSITNNGAEKDSFDKDGVITAPGLVSSSATYAGTATLSTGTATKTVFSGARCVCSDTTANASCKTSVASTTLTLTGTGSDVLAYFCF